jgi:nascent polypeptide-associated complex subunit beta
MHHAVVKDDKQLINTLKKLGANPIPGIEEVNLFRNDNMVITIKNPKVQTALACNTFSVSGAAVEKPVSEVMPSFSNMNPESLMQLRNLGSLLNRARAAGGAGGDGKPGAVGNDDDVPVPQENFDQNA